MDEVCTDEGAKNCSERRYGGGSGGAGGGCGTTGAEDGMGGSGWKRAKESAGRGSGDSAAKFLTSLVGRRERRTPRRTKLPPARIISTARRYDIPAVMKPLICSNSSPT
ncbi:hypothetical protein ECG_02091 [Echinococcus granulosus]|nr:hypothetical protein ECG_03422 [Echinococcus granulosus]KAH9286244.1 hypothetical protein ECG_02091 [Echinococcus granulosus]